MPDQGSSGPVATGGPDRRIPLIDAAPELASFLTEEECSLIEQIAVPVVQAEDSLQLEDLLERHSAFAAIVVDGLVVHQLGIGSEPSLRILGPGDLLAVANGQSVTLLGLSRYRAQSSTRLALLGNEVLIAARHAPQTLVGLQAAAAGQLERLSAQLVICQLPRVADRVLAMMWLLADSFGRVTPVGTRLPLSLTHETLGALVGARRPTVTLALGELGKRGALVHQDGGWLLLQPAPIGCDEEARPIEEPRLVEEAPSDWVAPRLSSGVPQTLAALTESVSRLRAQHEANVAQVDDRLRRFASAREHASEVRRRTNADRNLRLQRRRPPST
jgi:CRP/FNR family transcriptional regulator, cyclic AMP receptor protein